MRIRLVIWNHVKLTGNAFIRPISARSYVTSQTGFGKSPVSLCTVFAHRSSALLMHETSIFENPRSPHKTRPLTRHVIRRDQTKRKNIRTDGPKQLLTSPVYDNGDLVHWPVFLRYPDIWRSAIVPGEWGFIPLRAATAGQGSPPISLERNAVFRAESSRTGQASIAPSVDG